MINMNNYYLIGVLIGGLILAVLGSLALSIKNDQLKRVIANAQWALDYMGAEVYGGGPARALKICWITLNDHPFEFLQEWEQKLLVDEGLFPNVKHDEALLRKMLIEANEKYEKLTQLYLSTKTEYEKLIELTATSDQMMESVAKKLPMEVIKKLTNDSVNSK